MRLLFFPQNIQIPPSLLQKKSPSRASHMRGFLLERRRRDLNPRAAINDLHPFQGCPFGQLGYFSKLLESIITMNFSSGSLPTAKMIISEPAQKSKP